jgi:hypothetical protein
MSKAKEQAAQMDNMDLGAKKQSQMSLQDEVEAKKRLAAVQEQERVKDLEKAKASKKLKKVKYSKDELKVLMSEFCLSKDDAIAILQKSGIESGTANMDAAMRTLVNAL